VTTVHDAADGQLTPCSTEIQRSDVTDIEPQRRPCVVSGEPLASDVTAISRRDSNEFQKHRDPESRPSDAGGFDHVTSSGEGPGRQTSDICDRVEDCQPSDTAASRAVDTSRDVCNDVRPSRRANAAGDRSTPDRICDDCRTGSRRRTNETRSQSSQQSRNSMQRATKSTGRPLHASTNDRPWKCILREDDGRRRVSKSEDKTEDNRCRTTVSDQQSKCDHNRATHSLTNRECNSAASDRRDTTSGHVTRRSHSAKMASNATQLPGRRCLSSDDRRQRRRNQPDRELTPAPFHRKCCCATRTPRGQGHHVTSEGQSGSSARPTERRPLPGVASKPWARTLRDYGVGEKSPSPVRSRRSTPESANNWSSPRTTKSGSEVQQLPANRPSVTSSRVKRPTPADCGKTKSDTILVQWRSDKKNTSSAGPGTIPPSTSVRTVTPRPVSTPVAGRDVTKHAPRGQRTVATTPTRQTDHASVNSGIDSSGRVRGTSNCRRITTATTSQKDQKSTTVLSHNCKVKTADLCLDNSPSRAPEATSLRPELFQKSGARRRLRLVGNSDVISTSSSLTKRPPGKRSHTPSSSVGGNSSAVDQCAKGAARITETNFGHVTLMTSSTADHDRDLDFDQCEVGQLAYDGENNNSSPTINNILRLSSCSQRQRLETSVDINITNDTSDGLLQQSSISKTDDREIVCILSDLAGLKHSRSIDGASGVQENDVLDERETAAETESNIDKERFLNHFQTSTVANSNTSTKERQGSNDLGSTSEPDWETDRGSKKSLSLFDELEIERDFQFMDEILTCTTPEVCRFIKSPDRDESSTRSSSRSETAVSSSSCPISSTEERATRSIADGLLYTVLSVMSSPVIEVAKSLNQDHCLSSPQLTDYVAENCHKVGERHHHHYHVAGCQEDLVDCSPCSDEIVLSSSDTSTKCSLSSPSGSQLSQDSCRWKSPDDMTLVGDLEQRDGSAGNITLRQSAVNLEFSSTNCDTATKSFSSPGVSSLADCRPRLPLRRSRHFERHWSPDLSCFRQPRSPDLSDEDFAQRSRSKNITGLDDETATPSRSQLLRRLLFSGRVAEAEKLQRSSTSDRDTIRTSENPQIDSFSVRTDGITDDNDDLLVDVRRYRSLSRRDQDQEPCDVEELDHCPSTPPLAVFLSSEDISSTIFPLRHATSEPASSRSRAPFNASPLSVRNSPAVDCNAETRWSKRRKERRPLSECFGTTLAVKLTGTRGTKTLTRTQPTGNLLHIVALC